MEETAELITPFEQKRKTYFFKLGLVVRRALRQHKERKLLVKQISEGELKGDWRNVSEHCLVVSARARILAEWIGLPEATISKMLVGAALHDFSKKEEIEAATKARMENTSAWDAFEKVAEDAKKQLQEAGFEEDVIWLAQAAPYGSINQTEEILNKEHISDLEAAFIIIHYADSISQGSDWVSPMEIDPVGSQVNQLDLRLQIGESNPKYGKLNEEGRAHFQGETTFQAALRVGHRIEDRLSKLIQERERVSFEPKHLPERVDLVIKERINSIEL